MNIPQRFLTWSLAGLLFSCFLLDFAAARSLEGPSARPALRVSLQSKAAVQVAEKREGEIAQRFAPVFYQSLGENKRADYITNFDFDGDWRGDNNWAHADDRQFQLKGYVYYSVVETETHYFIHYAVFHTRDYKGGERKGTILSELIREGARRAGKYDPTGIAEESALAHENDMEGCLVVVAKDGNDLKRAGVVFVETLRHNTFAKYIAGEASAKASEGLRLIDGRPLLYIQPKGHGIEALTSDKQTSNKDLLVYSFTGRADDPEKAETDSIGYDLVPIQTNLWPRARDGVSATYGAVHDYGEVTIRLAQASARVVELKVNLTKIGIAFVGKVGGLNMARPPWGWFDRGNREETLGVWFFDPARTIKRDFHLDDSFSTVYLRTPFWAVGGKQTEGKPASAKMR
jgi:hypothetical protein